MSFYKKRPVVIEAITFYELYEFCLHNRFEYKGHTVWFDYVNEEFGIPTLEGEMRMTKGDMLITGVDGEIYPCKIDIFNRTYDRIDNDNS